jgi:hypothetical protein
MHLCFLCLTFSLYTMLLSLSLYAVLLSYILCFAAISLLLYNVLLSLTCKACVPLPLRECRATSPSITLTSPKLAKKKISLPRLEPSALPPLTLSPTNTAKKKPYFVQLPTCFESAWASPYIISRFSRPAAHSFLGCSTLIFKFRNSFIFRLQMLRCELYVFLPGNPALLSRAHPIEVREALD